MDYCITSYKLLLECTLYINRWHMAYNQCTDNRVPLYSRAEHFEARQQTSELMGKLTPNNVAISAAISACV